MSPTHRVSTTVYFGKQGVTSWNNSSHILGKLTDNVLGITLFFLLGEEFIHLSMKEMVSSNPMKQNVTGIYYKPTTSYTQEEGIATPDEEIP